MDRAEKNHRYYCANKPYPVRFGILKDKMQSDAFNNPGELGSTIHAVAISIIKNYYEKREVVRDTQLQKLMEIAQIRRYNISHHIYKKKYGNLYFQLTLF